jgi:hypothetical protein
MSTPPQAAAHPQRFLCRHIFADGHRCGSPALRHEQFCYYHHTTRPKASTPRRLAIYNPAIDLPVPEDRTSIQFAISQVILRIADGSLDPKRAQLLLYGLQIASHNLPRTIESYGANPVVEEIDAHPEHGDIAPVSPIPEEPTYSNDDEDYEEDDYDDSEDTTDPIAEFLRTICAPPHYPNDPKASKKQPAAAPPHPLTATQVQT